MSARALRNISAAHARITPDPDGTIQEAALGTVKIGLPVEVTTAPQGEDFLTAPTADALTLITDPRDDIRIGDFLDFSGFRHEVSEVRRLDRKRFGYGEVDVFRKEVPV